jgi:hypothetical protein
VQSSATTAEHSTLGPPAEVLMNLLWFAPFPGNYEAMLDVLGLSGMQKVTARLIEGIEIQQVRCN